MICDTKLNDELLDQFKQFERGEGRSWLIRLPNPSTFAELYNEFRVVGSQYVKYYLAELRVGIPADPTAKPQHIPILEWQGVVDGTFDLGFSMKKHIGIELQLPI